MSKSLIALILLSTMFFMPAAQYSYAGGDQLHIGSLDKKLQMKLQQTLKERGFDPGPIDGVFGRRTMDALLNFQKSISYSACPEDNNDWDIVPCLKTFALTPKLINVLWGLEVDMDYGNVEDLTQDEQLNAIRALRLIPTASYWADKGYLFSD